MRDIGLYILGGIGLIGCLMCLFRAALTGDVFMATVDIIVIVLILYIIGAYTLIGRIGK